ncbi:MAG TPA: hypothetical protein VFH80_14970 [Solirubrobacteraceae bacterium]|nr:hypothetical protein [Solirubrobacteraceae bacterium]
MSSGGPSALGAHLAEMDKLLREIQVGLVPGREPAPPLAPPAEPAQPDAPPAAAVLGPPTAMATATASVPPPTEAPQLQALTELSTRLLASIRELLAGYERVLVPSAPPPPSSRRAARHRPDSPDVTLAAGPFASLEALREFEQGVSLLPGVRDVAVRGYEGTDRAIIEVRLDQTNP